MPHSMVVVRKFGSEVEAQVAQLVLNAHGIPNVLLSDDAGGMIPALRVLIPMRLVVRADDAEEAIRLLDVEDSAPIDGDDEDR